jgi:hypothetical protein
MGKWTRNGEGTSYTDIYFKRKIKGVSEDIQNKILSDMNSAMQEVVNTLTEISPRDNTTIEMRKEAIKNGEVIPFVMDGERSADFYSYAITYSKSGKSVSAKILNDYAYVEYLNEGLMDLVGLLQGKKVRERTANGKYSEQAGSEFINETFLSVIKDYGYNLSTGRYETNYRYRKVKEE